MPKLAAGKGEGGFYEEYIRTKFRKLLREPPPEGWSKANHCKAVKALEKALIRSRSHAELARAIGVSGNAVGLWKKCPIERVISIEYFTGVPRDELRPDLFLTPRKVLTDAEFEQLQLQR